MSSNYEPVQTPITGAEDLGDLSRPTQALAQFYRAFNKRDLALIEENFAPTDEVAIDNPVGGIRRGRDEPRLMYERIFSSPADVRVEFWDYTIIECGEMFVAVGRERGTFLNPGGERRDLAIRTSRVYRRFDGKWRQVHHHGSIDDAALLAEFQAAIRR